MLFARLTSSAICSAGLLGQSQSSLPPTTPILQQIVLATTFDSGTCREGTQSSTRKRLRMRYRFILKYRTPCSTFEAGVEMRLG